MKKLALIEIVFQEQMQKHCFSKEELFSEYDMLKGIPVFYFSLVSVTESSNFFKKVLLWIDIYLRTF